MKFYLGTCEPSWLNQTDVPLFLSRRPLSRQKSWYRAKGPWALDSGAFTEISKFGRWTITPKKYVNEIQVWRKAIGEPDFCGIQDWMCEPFILKKTGFTIEEHQVRTIESYFDLKALDSSIPFVPTLQGWEHKDYLAHVDMWEEAGVRLAEQPLVAIGSVCRRQGMEEATQIVRSLASIVGLNIHAYGFKLAGIRSVGKLLKSSDSMAWSFAARYDEPLDGCSHRTCNNCLKYALKWREKIDAIDTSLFVAA